MHVGGLQTTKKLLTGKTGLLLLLLLLFIVIDETEMVNDFASMLVVSI